MLSRGTFRWHRVLVLYQDKTVTVSVDSYVERMTLEHNSWRFRLAPSIYFGGDGQVLERRGGCCGTTAWNKSRGKCASHASTIIYNVNYKFAMCNISVIL